MKGVQTGSLRVWECPSECSDGRDSIPTPSHPEVPRRPRLWVCWRSVEQEGTAYRTTKRFMGWSALRCPQEDISGVCLGVKFRAKRLR